MFIAVTVIVAAAFVNLCIYAWHDRHPYPPDRHNVENQVALVLEQIRRNEAEAADVGLTAADRRWLADVGVAEWDPR